MRALPPNGLHEQYMRSGRLFFRSNLREGGYAGFLSPRVHVRRMSGPKGIVVGALALIVVVLIISRFRLFEGKVGSNHSGAPNEHSSHKRGFWSFFDDLKRAGAKRIPPIAQQLQEAVKSGGHAEIARAFHEAIYDSFSKRSEAISAIEPFLADSDPFVRYSAGQALLTVGDLDGVPALLKLVQANSTIDEEGMDLRVQAAELLGQYRVADSAADIAKLYSETKNGDLLSALSKLGVAAAEEKSFPFAGGDPAISEYAMIGETRFLPKMQSLFASTTNPELKNATAWSLAKLTGDQTYITYLAQAAQAAIDARPKGEMRSDPSSHALRDLGSIESPVAVNTLQQALQSQNPVAVQYAVVNLIFNQSTNLEAATQVVLRELDGSQHMLGTDLMLNIAIKLDDPRIAAAGKAFDQRSGDNSWRLYSTQRRQWPIFNWIDSYVTTMNRK